MGSLFGFSGPADSAVFDRMSHALSHRGSHNLQKDASRHFQVFHQDNYRRQPERDVMAEQGARSLSIAGTAWFKEEGPCSPRRLLELYIEGGIDFVKDLRGFFILVIRDGTRVYLVRDGAGRRTVYYCVLENRLYFAVEAKALHGLPGLSRKLHIPALAQYLSFSFVPGEATMVSGIHELPAGHWLEFEEGRPLSVKRFFEFEEDPGPPVVSLEEAAIQFESILDRAAKELLPFSSTPVLFLSGGLDSSIVAAKLAELCSKPITTLSIYFGSEYTHELVYARQVASALGTDHHELCITPRNFIPSLRKAIWHLDDPIGDPVTIPNFEMAGSVPGTPEFIFNGEGGDPLFGGPKNMAMMLAHWYGGITRGPYFREKTYLQSFRRAYEEMKFLLTPDVLKELDEEEHLYKVLTPFFNAKQPEGFLDKLMAMNIRCKGAHLILPKVEKMLGAWNRVPLSPLFDERLIRFSFRIPGSMKVSNGIEKVVMKEAYKDRLPGEIIERPKSGMRVPVHFWFQKEMQAYARKVLSRKRIRQGGVFQWDRVKQLLDYNIQEGPGRYGLRLWMLLTFEIWRQIVIEGEKV